MRDSKQVSALRLYPEVCTVYITYKRGIKMMRIRVQSANPDKRRSMLCLRHGTVMVHINCMSPLLSNAGHAESSMYGTVPTEPSLYQKRQMKKIRIISPRAAKGPYCQVISAGIAAGTVLLELRRRACLIMRSQLILTAARLYFLLDSLRSLLI